MSEDEYTHKSFWEEKVSWMDYQLYLARERHFAYLEKTYSTEWPKIRENIFNDKYPA